MDDPDREHQDEPEGPESERTHRRAADPDAGPAAERAVSYDIAALGRRRFLNAVAEICWRHQVSWEWNLAGSPGYRRVGIVFRGSGPALDAVAHEIAVWRRTEATYWSAGGTDGPPG